jgi:hypothetical protein
MDRQVMLTANVERCTAGGQDLHRRAGGQEASDQISHCGREMLAVVD